MTFEHDTPTRAQCVERVYRPHQFQSGQCGRKGVVERDGKPYCRQHDPEAVKAREAERQAQYRAENEELRKRNAKATRDRAFVEACERYLHEDRFGTGELEVALFNAQAAYTAALGQDR